MTFIGIFIAYNVDSFLCWVYAVKGTLAAQAGFVNELISGSASSPNSHLNVFELLQLCFPLNFFFFLILSSVSLCMQEKLEVQGNVPVKPESSIARCIWESFKFFWVYF